MKKPLILFTCLLMSLYSFYSCQSDDDTTPPDSEEMEEMEEAEEVENTADITAIIELITGGSSKTWKIESAQLLNTSGATDLQGLYNIQDDEFIFSSHTETSMRLRHRRGYRVDSLAQNIEDARSDVRVSPIETIMDADNDSEHQFLDFNRYILNYNEDNQTITGVYGYGDGLSLSLVLTEKTAADYAVPSTSVGTLSEVFSFEANQPVLDMKFSYTTESLYMVSRKEAFEQQLIKYGLTDGTSASQMTSGGDYVAQQLAFVEDKVVTISSNELGESNFDLSGNPQTSTISSFSGEFDYRTIAINNQIYKIGGHNGLGLDAISLLNYGDNAFSLITTANDEKSRVGAEIVDNKLYTIGGFVFDSQGQIVTYNEIVTYDLGNNLNTETIILPAHLSNTFTARYENLIYIAGRRFNGAGQAFTNYLTVFNTLDNTFQEIDITGMLPHTMIMREMTVSDTHIYFAIQTPGTNNLFGITILEGDLN